MLERLGQFLILAISAVASVVLLLLIFMTTNPAAFWHTAGEIHNSLASAFGALGIGLIILFFAGLVLGSAAIGTRIIQSWKVQVIPVNEHGSPPAVVIHEKGVARVEHLATGQMDTQQLLTALRQSMQLNVVSANALKRMSAYLEEAGDVVDELPPGDKQGQLPPPKKMYKLIDVLRTGCVGNDGEYVIGYKRDGTSMAGKLFDVEDNLYNSIFTVGDQGGGKTAFAVLIAAYTIKHGGRLLIIDPEKGQRQSLTERLGPLVNKAFLLHEIADTPEKAEKLLSIAESEIETPGDYPVAFLVDELSMIARQAEVGMGKWAEVGKRCLSILEDYATRGRKRIRRSVVMGQFTQGKRNGGTTLRYAMATMCFRIDKKQSQLALDQEDAEQTPTLEPGEVIVIPSRSSEPKARMKVVYPDEEALQIIAQVALEVLTGLSISSEFRETPSTFQEPDLGEQKRTGKVLEISQVSPEMAYRARVRRVRELRKQNKNQTQIIETIWGVTPGASDGYIQARDEFKAIMSQIALEDARAEEG